MYHSSLCLKTNEAPSHIERHRKSVEAEGLFFFFPSPFFRWPNSILLEALRIVFAQNSSNMQ